MNVFVKMDPSPLPDPVPPPTDPGRYILTLCGCRDCHTPMDDKGQYLPGMDFGGGFVFKGPFGEVASANITSDKATGMGNATPLQWEQAIRTGIRKDGQPIIGPMPWNFYAGMSAADMGALIPELMKIPALSNTVPERKPAHPVGAPAPAALPGAESPPPPVEVAPVPEGTQGSVETSGSPSPPTDPPPAQPTQ